MLICFEKLVWYEPRVASRQYGASCIILDNIRHLPEPPTKIRIGSKDFDDEADVSSSSDLNLDDLENTTRFAERVSSSVYKGPANCPQPEPKGLQAFPEKLAPLKS
ncbi:hypothetical protein QYF36_010447 [Acer negundo]|nr:hypothetical protein QYF36_010447 [Acer negundo]